MKVFHLTNCAAALMVALTVTVAHAVTIEMVTVGNPGNAADATTGYGAVAYDYRIGKHEVTIGQYAAFLNAVAKTDTYELFDPRMATDQAISGIYRSGPSGSYAYWAFGPFGTNPSGASGFDSRPIAYISWFRAARFANWMANGQPTGLQAPETTEDGAYAISGTTVAVARNSTNPNTGATPTYWIPTENEWYKAAYYKRGGMDAGYWNYATQSDIVPGNFIGAGSNQANYSNGKLSVTQQNYFSSNQNYLSDVGAFGGSSSSYGTFDQSGNVFEWTDGDGTASMARVYRGGGWNDSADRMSRASRQSNHPTAAVYELGFRLAGSPAVPELNPTGIYTVGALIVGAFGVAERRRWQVSRCTFHKCS